MENLNLNIHSSCGEVVIRQGAALPAKEPNNILIEGTLDSPVEYLSKRISLINQSESFVTVNRDKMSIRLVINEHSPYRDIIVGSLSVHPDFIKFGINSGKYRTAIEMAEFIKMNRAHFENRQDAMDLVTLLRKFKAKVDKQVESEFNPGKGDKRVLVAQTVESNMPPSFKVCIPIFKGTPKQVIELETYFNPEDLTCTLVSPQANEIAEDFKNAAIDDVIDRIRGIAPDIVIIEV